MKAKIALIAFLLLFLAVTFSVPVSFAARSLVISSDKTTLMGYEQMTITASASGFTNGETIYIKGAFYQDGSTNYFGYTKSGDNWIKNSNSTLNQRTVKIGDWDNSLVIESDFSDSGFKGEGNYKFKVGFYTSSNTSSVNWSSNNLDIYLNEPDPTLTNTPTQGPTAAPTSTPTSLPTPSKTPTPKPSVSPTPIKTLTPTKEPQRNENSSTGVLGSSTQNDTPTANEPSKQTRIQAPSIGSLVSIFFIIMGIIFAALCGIVFAWPHRHKLIEKFRK